jgi:hypothetical protein
LTRSIQKNHKIQIAILFAIYILVQIAFRPEILTNGRLFAEEGSIWWAHSLNSNFLSTLFFIPPLTGYFLLNANLLMLFTNLIPISYIALMTTWVSLLLHTQIAFVSLVLTKGREWKYRILCFSILLFSPIFSDPESFANSINSQTYLALVPIIYLALWTVPHSFISRVYIYTLMLLSFFSGWYGAILFPLFLIRYFLGDRSKFHKLVVGVSFFGFCTQIFTYIYQIRNDLLWPNKGRLKFDYREISLDFLSILKFSFTGVQGFSSINPLQLCLTVTILILATMRYFSSNQPKPKFIFKENKYVWLACAFAVEYFLVYVGDAEPGTGLSGRYLIVPSGILVLFLAINFADNLAQISSKSVLAFIAIIQFMLSTLQFSMSSSHPLLRCSMPCLTWKQNVDMVASKESSAYYFWPFNEGNPNWAISAVQPKVRLAPFQSEKMGLVSEDLPPMDLKD